MLKEKDPGLVRNARQAQYDATRATILAIARQCFMEKGYYDTTIETIIGTAQVSKGAFYHHFKSKEDIFHKVYVEIHKEIAVAARASAKIDDAWLGLVAAFDCYFEQISKPNLYRLLYKDARSVLTSATLHAVDEEYGNAVVDEVTQRVQAFGLLPNRLDPFTHVVLGGVVDALVNWSASQPDFTTALKEAQRTFTAFLTLLRDSKQLSKNMCGS